MIVGGHARSGPPGRAPLEVTACGLQFRGQPDDTIPCLSAPYLDSCALPLWRSPS
jgi:hypothetical protein